MKSRVNLNASKDKVGSQQIFVLCLLEAYPVLAEGISHIKSLILKPEQTGICLAWNGDH